MTGPAAPRPVPGPPRPGSAPADGAVLHGATLPDAPAGGSPFAGLAERPVAEHVGVFEAEHERLQRDLSTIDQL